MLNKKRGGEGWCQKPTSLCEREADGGSGINRSLRLASPVADLGSRVSLSLVYRASYFYESLVYNNIIEIKIEVLRKSH